MGYYTGIGSRNIPNAVLKQLEMAAVILSTIDKNIVLRSGGAAGSDTAFQNGALQHEIFLPWKSFSKKLNPAPKGGDGLLLKRDVFVLGEMDKSLIEYAEHLVKKVTPYWDKLNAPVKKLYTRNAFQVLGKDLKTPSDFVMYWAPERKGVVSGGTRVAVDIARMEKIPTFNFNLGEIPDIVTINAKRLHVEFRKYYEKIKIENTLFQEEELSDIQRRISFLNLVLRIEGQKQQ